MRSLRSMDSASEQQTHRWNSWSPASFVALSPCRTKGVRFEHLGKRTKFTKLPHNVQCLLKIVFPEQFCLLFLLKICFQSLLISTSEVTRSFYTHFTALLSLSSATWYLLPFASGSSGSDLVSLVNYFFNQLHFSPILTLEFSVDPVIWLLLH